MQHIKVTSVDSLSYWANRLIDMIVGGCVVVIALTAMGYL